MFDPLKIPGRYATDFNPEPYPYSILNPNPNPKSREQKKFQ